MTSLIRTAGSTDRRRLRQPKYRYNMRLKLECAQYLPEKLLVYTILFSLIDLNLLSFLDITNCTEQYHK